MNFVYILFVGVDKMVLHARASLFVLFGWHVFIPGSMPLLRFCFHCLVVRVPFSYGGGSFSYEDRFLRRFVSLRTEDLISC